jgi:hemerythrin
VRGLHNGSVNITEIDKQHKKLIELINDLHDAMRVGQGKAVLEKTLNELVSYTKTHFGYEESLMQQFGYSNIIEHKGEHDRLTAKVVEMQKQYHDGKLVITMEVMGFLKQWLNVHILDNDKKYTSFFNAKGIK